jgi:hypothetical protein
MITETLPNDVSEDSQEMAVTNLSESQQYIADRLQQHDIVDIDGISRPAYVINGREIVFRTRQEAPIFEDSEVAVPGGKSVYPLERQAWDDDSEGYKMTDESAVRAYVDGHQDDAPRSVVTNTPEGMLAAAALVAESAEDRARLQELAATFAAGTSWTEAQKEVIDTMLAAVSVDDQGKLKDNLDMNGWPLALAALSGDTTARLMLDTKREGLAEAERGRASDPGMIEKAAAYQAERGIESSEPIPLEQLALVHSTSHEVQRDEDGTVVLRTLGQLRDDRYPRASLHFTLNSRVGDMYANGQKQEWSDANKIIVANFKRVIDASHTLPNRMAGMDTWFMLNPGETLKLPDALVVEQVEKTPSGKVLEETETGVQYVVKDTYTAEDQTLLSELSYRYGVGNPKDVALYIAMDRVGAPINLMDSPSGDGHGMNSHVIGNRVDATAISLGLPSGKHFESPEAYMENKAFLTMPKMLGKLALEPYALQIEHMTSYSTAAIEARRQALASGFYPARPNVFDEKKAWLYQSGNSGV